LGVIEFRAFEMMPQADMLLVLNALVRALAAALSESPFQRPLIDWRGALQDRMALPWFLRRDLQDVLQFLQQSGFEFKPAWFEPHLDFRFPILTRFQTRGVAWTLRQAIEPWPVMGDHVGTGRTVDASTDRLELLAEGAGAGTDILASVNGLQVPLTAVGDRAAVGGIRFRLYSNPWGLQPQVEAHSPLRFEFFDPHTHQLLHAFEFHNWKRDKGPYEGLPKTKKDAERRVAERLVFPAHPARKAGPWQPLEPDPATPFTLDLRCRPRTSPR
jgi:uncharacterized protein (DUF2126 family)